MHHLASRFTATLMIAGALAVSSYAVMGAHRLRPVGSMLARACAPPPLSGPILSGPILSGLWLDLSAVPMARA